MKYIGEHLLPGQLGHFFVLLSFVAASLSTIAYFLATRRRDQPAGEDWRNLGRFSYLLHGLATLGVIGTLFFILTKKYYEYQYAWANVADDLPFRYTFSAFWKEQQGSFLLWSFWHIVLGIVVMVRGGRWEAPVLTFVALAETLIASMILGLYFGDFRLGASPFDLLRHTMDAPIFAQADYLSKISGNGLNPLLQNYWMTIHPPTLFLGFASTIIPFAYAASGLWLREHRDWLKPALPWALFSGAILGLGILMGGAWAYEALSFAGYWAWDPVENTSLVPWLTLVAGIHAALVARNTGYSVRSAYAFFLLTFILILYSTYLTRSGILGDTSVHSFTEMGLGFQLVLFIGLFSALSLWLWVSGMKDIPRKDEEEAATSREFWMFIGALVLFFSGVLITGATSLPVWNKIVQAFDPDYVGAALKDPVAHHNRYQLWIAVFIGLLSGVAQWLRYNERTWPTRLRTFVRHMIIAAVSAGLLSALNALWLNARAWQYVVMLFAGMFALSANADYLISFLKGNIKQAGSALSHIGFGILVLGILGTGLNKEWISTNPFAMEGLIEGMDGEAMSKNVLLLREAALPMSGGYEATYLRDTMERQTRSFTVRFKKMDQEGNYTGESFELSPNVMYDRQRTKVVAANPSTKHYLTHDVFTLVSSLPKVELDAEFAKQQEDSLRFESYSAAAGDTVFTKTHYLVIEGFTKQPVHREYKPEKGDLAFGMKVKAFERGKPGGFSAAPMLYLRQGRGGFTLADDVGQLKLRLRLTEASIMEWLRMENELQYTFFPVKGGETFDFQGYKIHFVQATRDIRHPGYVADPEDQAAVAAELEVQAPDGRKATAAPVFVLRGNQPFNIKDEAPELGLHFRFEKVDPETKTLTIGVAKSEGPGQKIPFEMAENAPRSDYIVLEAIIFPGINFVWLGSLLMLFGLGLSMWRRLVWEK